MLTAPVSTEHLEAALADIDGRLRQFPQAPELCIERGRVLELLGRNAEAVQTYVAVLQFAPGHTDALCALGRQSLAAGNRVAARTLLSNAVSGAPANAAALADLACVQLLDDDVHGAKCLYERSLDLDPELPAAHDGLSQVLPLLEDHVGAERHRAAALRRRPLRIDAYAGEGRPIYVLALSTAANGNIPTDGYFDNRIFLLASLNVDFADLEVALPLHDIVFNAIAEADLCADALARAAAIAGRSTAPIINPPTAVAATNRVGTMTRLRDIDGIVAPRTIGVGRDVLSGPSAAAWLADAGFSYPFLVRSPGYHTGDHFVKVDCASELTAAVAQLPGDELLVIEYVDLRAADGTFRKYRVMIVDGDIYPLHLAISYDWKVHYFRSAMAQSAGFRSEDAQFLTAMRDVIGSRALAALEGVRDALALDYGGIDFALDAQGDAIVFEANASMRVVRPDPEAIWEYRRGPVARVRSAVREMLVTRAARSR